MLFELKTVFSNHRNVAISIIVTVLLFFVVTLLPHLSTFTALYKAGFGLKVTKSFLAVITSNNSFFSLISLTGISVLTGIYVPIVITFIKKRRGLSRRGAGGVVGSTLGMLGAGCAACGTALLGPLITFLGIGSLLVILPFNGIEFTLIGIIIIILSIRSLLRKLANTTAAVCQV